MYQAQIQVSLKTTDGWAREMRRQVIAGEGFVLTGELITELQESDLNLETLLAGITVTDLLSTEFQGYDLDADGLLEAVTDDGEEILLHFEFQSSNDKTMPERLLEYSFRAKQKHKKLPYSCAIFLRKDGIVPKPPLCWALRNGKKILAFEYLCIKLWEITPEELLALKQPALLPLLPLTKDSANRIIIKRMYQELLAHGLYDLMPIAHSLASQVLEKSDLQWSERLFTRMKRNILKDTPGYIFMTKEAREEGREEGLEEVAKAREEVAKVRSQNVADAEQYLLHFDDEDDEDATSAE